MAEEKTTRHMPFKELVPDEVLEHMKAARAEMRKSMEAILPPGFIEHRRAARKEMLKAARAMIDAALDKMDEREKQKS